MRLYVSNETGHDIFLVYPAETPDEDRKLELFLQLHDSRPPINFGTKQIYPPPRCAAFDLLEISAEKLEVDLRPSGNFKIEWEYGTLPAEGSECRMLRILKIISTSRRN